MDLTISTRKEAEYFDSIVNGYFILALRHAGYSDDEISSLLLDMEDVLSVSHDDAASTYDNF